MGGADGGNGMSMEAEGIDMEMRMVVEAAPVGGGETKDTGIVHSSDATTRSMIRT